MPDPLARVEALADEAQPPRERLVAACLYAVLIAARQGDGALRRLAGVIGEVARMEIGRKG